MAHVVPPFLRAIGVRIQQALFITSIVASIAFGIFIHVYIWGDFSIGFITIPAVAPEQYNSSWVAWIACWSLAYLIAMAAPMGFHIGPRPFAWVLNLITSLFPIAEVATAWARYLEIGGSASYVPTPLQWHAMKIFGLTELLDVLIVFLIGMQLTFRAVYGGLGISTQPTT